MAAPPGATPGDSIETLYVDIAARADRLVADAEAAVNQVVTRMQQIDRAAENISRTYSRLGATIKQALTIATGISFYNMTTQVITRVVNLGKQLISTNAQMQMFQKSFEVLTGSAQEAGEIIDWVREQAKKTPFDVPGLIQASQMLMTWGLDLKEWFTVVGDVAAGMNRPITQVVNAIGTLATGQTGEAVRRFRDLGINLREFTDVLQFDAQGSLITPLEEAIPIVKEIMIDKFGGMMESQSKTWEGVMSNMSDTWQQFVQVVGEPLFQVLNQQLIQLSKWVEENSDEIENFAENLGSALVAAFNTLTGILGGFGQLIGLIDEVITKITGMPDWVERGITTGEKLIRLAAAVKTRQRGFFGDVIQGESIEEASQNANAAWRKTMLEIAGYSEKAKEEIIADAEEMTAGYEAVYYAVTEGLTKRIKEPDEAGRLAVAKPWVEQGRAAQRALELITAMEEVGLATEGASEKFREQHRAVLAMYQIYQDATTAAEELARAEAEAAAALEAQAQAAQEALDLAMEMAPDLTDTLRKAMEAMASGLQAAGEASGEAIAEITAKAQAAELAAITANQAAVTKLQEDYKRDQLRRQEQFNRRWERLIREQNDINLDAAWEYEYARQQLLIEGDEIALAELEERYKHEQETRDRDQGQEQSDMREEFERQQAELEAAFEERVKALEDRLQVELAKVREEADKAAKAQQEKDEETRTKQEENAEDLHQRLGEMLYDQTQGNDEAAQLILAAWSQMYSGIELEAIWTAYTVRQQMMATIALIIQAQQELEKLRNLSGYIPTSDDGDPLYPWSHTGGYTPGVERPVITKPGEFVSTPSTTQALENALGGRLTQESLQRLALSTTQRRLLDVNIKGTGVPANILQRAYRDMIKAMTEKSGEY